MAHFEDLTPYSYSPGEPDVLNVGWLSGRHPFPRGPVSERFVIRLQLLLKFPCALTRGHHSCDICQPPQDVIAVDPSYFYVWAMGREGNGEIRCKSESGKIYAAPIMIWHYILEHQYQPPQEFIDAVLYAAAHPTSQPDWEKYFTE